MWQKGSRPNTESYVNVSYHWDMAPLVDAESIRERSEACCNNLSYHLILDDGYEQPKCDATARHHLKPRPQV